MSMRHPSLTLLDVRNTTTAPGSGVDILGDASDTKLAALGNIIPPESGMSTLLMKFSTASPIVTLVEYDSAGDNAESGTVLSGVAVTLGQWAVLQVPLARGNQYNLQLSEATAVVDRLLWIID